MVERSHQVEPSMLDQGAPVDVSVLSPGVIQRPRLLAIALRREEDLSPVLGCLVGTDHLPCDEVLQLAWEDL